MVDIGDPTGSVPWIINITSRCSSKFRIPMGNVTIKKKYYIRRGNNKNQPTDFRNSSILIAGNRIRRRAGPNFARRFFPSFGSSPDFSQANCAQRITLKKLQLLKMCSLTFIHIQGLKINCFEQLNFCNVE